MDEFSRSFSAFRAESAGQAREFTKHPIRVTTRIRNFDRTKDGKHLASIDSGQDDPFLSNRTTIPRDGAANAEGWVALCAQAAVEKDPKKLLELVSEINRLLDVRRKRLANGDDGTMAKT